MNVQKIGIVGAGTMGNGIAQAFAVAGFDVVLTDVAEKALQQALNTISGSLDRLIKKEKATPEQKAAALAKIAVGTDLGLLRDCGLIIEAATENEVVKRKLFAQLDEIAQPQAILASNTSTLSITSLAAATKRPAQVIGMHFFNPVPMMALVEVTSGLQTSAATCEEVESIARQLGKTPVKLRNSPGFVVNRLLIPMINEAIFTLADGVATATDIDEAMKLGANHPIGPLALADLIGLDVTLAIMQVLYGSFNDSKYRAAPLLVEMVEAGYLGRKSGRGFFSYN